MIFDKKIVAILAGTVVAVLGFIYWGMQDGKNQIDQTQINTDPNAIVYYYGEGCPHCKVVNDFLVANPQVAEKVSFEKKEVWSNKTNATEMESRAKACGIKPEGMGVPFLYGGDGKCYVGEPEVTGFFKTKSGMTTDTPIETQK
jgi:glutaredoxin